LGSVNYYRNLLHAIYALPDRQIEPVLLLGERTEFGPLGDLPVEVIRSRWLDPLTPRWAIRKIWQQTLAMDPFMERFLRSNRLDVFSHSDFLGNRAAVPAICWIGDFQHRELPQFFSRVDRWYRDRDFRMQCRHATRVIVSSREAQRALAEFEPCCVEKSRVLPFVAQPNFAGEVTDLETIQQRYGFTGRYFHVPNQFWAHKNHRLILDALAILKGHEEPILVISTGATEDSRRQRFFGELIAQADALGVLDSFRTLGVVPYQDLVGLMVNAVALINPSRAEGWSTSVEEAKSLGKRIILSDIPVHREQAPPDGAYVDPDDAAGLADAMRAVLTTFDSVEERRRATRARRSLPGRVRVFGEAYQQIVMAALGDHGARVGSWLGAGAIPVPGPSAPELVPSRCPRCSALLGPSGPGWRCTTCGWTSSSTDGIPNLLADPAVAEFSEHDHDRPHAHKAAQAAHFDAAEHEAFEINRPHGAPRLYSFMLHEKLRRAIEPIRRQLPGASALIVCGGSGMEAEFVAGAGANVTTSDLSLGAAARAMARSDRHNLGLHSVVADVEHLPYADQSVDLVAVHDGLHHLDDPDAGLAEMARVARRWVVVSEPARASITRLAIRLGLALEIEEAGNRVGRMDPLRTSEFLEAHGYTVLRGERYAMYYPHHPGRVFRLLSRPIIFPAVRVGWRVANALIGRFGNKMVVIAERRDSAPSNPLGRGETRGGG
jgi:glycosyltransferase involved in cell wall biosynthesis/SAM-dependent methyltransferase